MLTRSESILDHIADYVQCKMNAQLAKHMVNLLMLATAADKVVLIIVVGTVIDADVIVPVAVLAPAFVVHCPLFLSSHQLAVACCFTSVAGIFAACPSFG